MRRGAVLLGSIAVASCTVGESPALAVFPGSNGKIAVTTEAYPGPCGDCNPGGGRAWILSHRGHAVSLPARTVAFSPSGARLAYEDDDGQDLWIARSDGSSRRLLSSDGFAPAWSPQGGLVAYNRYSGGPVVASANGSDRWRLRVEADFFAWSPDGHELAVAIAGSLRRVGFRGLHQRTFATLDPLSSAGFSGVAWSRSGWVSYLRGEKLEIVRPSGGEAHTLASGMPPCCGDGLYSYFDYSWSPDGQRIAFVRDGALWVMRVPDGTPRLLVPRGEMGIAPQWSPDGRVIAYVRGARRGHRLLTVRANGGQPRLFGTFNDRTSGEEFVVDVDWQARPPR